MSEIINALGLNDEIIPTRNVRNFSLITTLLEHIESEGGYVSFGSEHLIGRCRGHYSIEFKTVEGRPCVFMTYPTSSMTYTEFKKKYKNLPQFLEEWKKHKEANG